MDLDVRRVGDMGALPDSLPVFLLPQVPWTLETLWIVLPVSLTLTVVGLLESLLTAAIVDDLTDTPRSEEHTSELQSLMRISYAVFSLKKKKQSTSKNTYTIS